MISKEDLIAYIQKIPSDCFGIEITQVAPDYNFTTPHPDMPGNRGYHEEFVSKTHIPGTFVLKIEFKA